MHAFHEYNGQWHCEETPLLTLAERFQTPLYVYSHRTLVDHFQKLQNAIRPAKPLICFSMKANASLALCRALIRQGAGVDIVSGGELHKAGLAGASPRTIVYASVGKTVPEIAEAVRRGILCFNVESLPELERIDALCRRLKRRQMVALRINPNVDPRTHAFISTGRGTDKFGLGIESAERIFLNGSRYPGVLLRGVHLHIGSQITTPTPFLQAIRKAMALIRRLRQKGVSIQWLNIGGGLGIVYHRERPQTAADFARAVLPLILGHRLRLILEPGRFIVGNSGVLLTRVLYLKDTPTKRFAIVDAGMNDLIRPSLYGAYHDIRVVVPRPGAAAPVNRYDVVGPICESGDFLARERPLPPLAPGDLLAVMGTGAYGFVMASNYNARPRPAEVLVLGRHAHLIRRRETIRDLVRGEIIPKALAS